MPDSSPTISVSRLDLEDGTSLALHTCIPDDQRGVVVLIHGIFGSKEDFDPILPFLAEHGFATCSFDQRGVHDSTSDGPFTMQAFAEDVAELVEGVGSDIPVHLVGQGFGGLVAQEAALMEPDFWDSVTFVGSGPGGMGPTGPLTFLEEGLRNEEDLHTLHDRFLEMLGEPEEDPDPGLEDRLATTDRRAVAAMVDAAENAPVRTDELHETGIAFHVVYGEHADAWPVTPQENMARDLQTSPVVLRGCAENPADDQPQQMARCLVENFLELD